MSTGHHQAHETQQVRNQSGYSIKRMSLDEMENAIQWAEQQGWNPGLNDGECFYSADPDGFFMGIQDGKPIASVSAVRYDDNFGFMGFYIVQERHRGKGYGMPLFQHALQNLKVRTVGADGVIDRLNDYATQGFHLAHFNYRYVGTGGGECPNGVHDLHGIPFDDIRRYDQQFFPADRPAFLWRWVSQGEAFGYGVIQNGELGGYGVIRKCRTGYKIGPLFADNDKLADRLFRALISQVPGEQVFLDIPDPNPGAEQLVKRYDMHEVFSTGRIYRGPAPDLPMHGIYGITSFELG